MFNPPDRETVENDLQVVDVLREPLYGPFGLMNELSDSVIEHIVENESKLVVPMQRGLLPLLHSVERAFANGNQSYLDHILSTRGSLGFENLIFIPSFEEDDFDTNKLTPNEKGGPFLFVDTILHDPRRVAQSIRNITGGLKTEVYTLVGSKLNGATSSSLGLVHDACREVRVLPQNMNNAEWLGGGGIVSGDFRHGSRVRRRLLGSLIGITGESGDSLVLEYDRQRASAEDGYTPLEIQAFGAYPDFIYSSIWKKSSKGENPIIELFTQLDEALIKEPEFRRDSRQLEIVGEFLSNAKINIESRI